MVENKKTIEAKNGIQKKTDRKKATVGAWWKSSVEVDTDKEQNLQEPKVTKRGRPRKKSTQDSTADPQKKTPRGKKVSDTIQSEDAGDISFAEVSVEKKKPGRKRPSRQKSLAENSTTTDGAAKKPSRKRAPRNKKQEIEEAKIDSGESSQTAAALDEIDKPLDQKAQAEATDVDAGENKTKPARPARPKRAPRKKRTTTSTSISTKAGDNQQNKVDVSKEGAAEGDIASGSSESFDLSTEAETSILSPTDAAAKEPVEPKEKISETDDLAVDSKSEKTSEKKAHSAAKEKSVPKPVIKLLINAEEPEECRLALLEDGRLESIHVATSTRTQTKNNIYKARIVAIEPNLQAAFVDYGTEKNGFLPFSEIHPEYYKENVSDKAKKLIEQHQWKKLSIIDVLERGREVLVQVVKEEVGKKGANMTTYLSLPGRCVVLMPGSDSTGISRKISGEERRSRLRDHLSSMDIPEGIGWIVRTASEDITKTALGRDVNYLLRLWDDVKKKGQDLEGVGLIYQDHDHVLRFLREHFDPDIQEILVDDKDALDQVKKFVELLPSKQRNVKCKLHRGSRPIFNQYSIEDQIESIYQPKVNLPSGGSIVIDPTEALVAIDVNSGSTSKGQNFEETIFQANVEAARELARQLRLRDLGGLVVVDFIDMRSKKNIREVERQLKVAMKRDKAKVDISRISKFGLLQISRQKLGAPIEAGNYRVCTNCKGRGIVRSVETLALYYLRRIHTAASRKMVYQIECRFPLDVAQYLLNNKRHELRELEKKYTTEVVIIADPSYKPADNDIIFHKTEKDDSTKKQP